MSTKIRVHAVDTRFGRKWRVVLSDGFAVRFHRWDWAVRYAFDHAEGRSKKRPKLSEATAEGA